MITTRSVFAGAGLLTACLVFLGGGSDAGFLWFESAPNPEDPCVITVTDSRPQSWRDVHPDPSCDKGGLLWFGLWGGVHIHLYTDVHKEKEFRLCLTGGEADTIAILYDYIGKYWSPIFFPSYKHELTERDQCRHSLNGTMDLYIRGIRWGLFYYSFLTWEIEPSDTDQTVHETAFMEGIKQRQERAKQEREAAAQVDEN